MVDLQDAPPEPVHGSERPLNFELSMLGAAAADAVRPVIGFQKDD